MSQSMKLYKPNYSYGATKSNFSESHEEFSTQSNYANNSWANNVKQPNYNYQAHDNQMGHGRSMSNCGGLGSGNRSTNYYAQAQCAQPSPSINMVQTAQVETMKRQESLKDHQASQYGLVNSSPTIGKQHGVIIHEEEHVIEKVESSVVNTPTSYPGPARANQFGVQASAYNYSEGGVEKAWANKPTKYLGKNQSNQSMQTMYNEHGQDGWTNSPTKFSKSQSNHSNHMIDEMGHGPNLPTDYCGPIKTNNSGLKMYKDEHVMEKSDLVVVNPSTQLPDPIRENRYGQPMHGVHSPNHGLVNQAAQYSGPNQLGYSGNNVYKDQGMAHNSAYGSAQNGLMGGQVNHSANGVGQNGFGSGQANHSAYSAGQNGFGSGQANYSSNGVGQHGFGSGQANYSSNGVGQHGFGSGQANHSSNGVGQHGFGSGQVNHSAYGAAQTGFGAPNANYSANGVSQNRFEAAQNNHSAYGAAKNNFGAPNANYSTNGIAKNGFESGQINNSGYNTTQKGFGSVQANHSAHGSYNYQDHEEADEGVHEIMDEILAKYPAHNVSSGAGPNWATKPNGYVSQNQGASYAKQQSFSGQGQHGIAAQSSSNKFGLNNEVKAGYMGNNMKKEFSHSSSSNKFEMNGRANNGGLCNNRVETDDACDF